nr:hypothetical protein [uncultured Erwinia sp.]
MDMEKAHDAVAQVIGSAVIQLIAEGRAVANDAIAEVIERTSGQTPDLAVGFALDLLRR